MPPKRIKSIVVPRNKQVRELVQTDIDRGPPVKRTHSSEADPEIIMTITQPVNSNKANKDRPKYKNAPAHLRAQEASNIQNSMLIVHPNSGVQHASNVAPVPGQHQLQLHQSSLPWWAWGPPPPPNPWNWNMWSPGAFHQLSLTNPTGQHTISQPTGTPNQFGGFLLTTTVATPTGPASTATTGPVQQEHQSEGQKSSPHWSPSASSKSTSPVSNPPDNTEEEQLDPLVSVLSFSNSTR